MLLHALKVLLHYGLLIGGRQRPQKVIDLTTDCLTHHKRTSSSPASCTAFVPLGAVDVELELWSSVDPNQLGARWAFGGAVGEARGVTRRSDGEGKKVHFPGVQVSAVMGHTLHLDYFPTGFTAADTSHECGADTGSSAECQVELQLTLASVVSITDVVDAGQQWTVVGTNGALSSPFIWVEFDAGKQNMLPLPLTPPRTAKSIFKAEQWESALSSNLVSHPKALAEKKTHQRLDAAWNQLDRSVKGTYGKAQTDERNVHAAALADAQVRFVRGDHTVPTVIGEQPRADAQAFALADPFMKMCWPHIKYMSDFIKMLGPDVVLGEHRLLLSTERECNSKVKFTGLTQTLGQL